MCPVSDIDRAMAFYAERAGFTIDYDTALTEEYRVVQLTPPARVLDPDRDGGVDEAAGVPAVGRAHGAGSLRVCS
jgi:predicted enzyme related to lactoylglutathione lyase